MNSKFRVLYGIAAQASYPRLRRGLRESELGIYGWEVAVWLFVACAAIGLVMSLLAKA